MAHRADGGNGGINLDVDIAVLAVYGGKKRFVRYCEITATESETVLHNEVAHAYAPNVVNSVERNGDTRAGRFVVVERVTVRGMVFGGEFEICVGLFFRLPVKRFRHYGELRSVNGFVGDLDPAVGRYGNTGFRLFDRERGKHVRRRAVLAAVGYSV